LKNAAKFPIGNPKDYFPPMRALFEMGPDAQAAVPTILQMLEEDNFPDFLPLGKLLRKIDPSEAEKQGF
jgi:hypothetical protein